MICVFKEVRGNARNTGKVRVFLERNKVGILRLLLKSPFLTAKLDLLNVCKHHLCLH